MTNEELEQEVKRLEEQITNLRIKILESKTEKKPYEVEVPEDLEDYFYVDETGLIYKLSVYVEAEQIKILNRGLAFKTREEAERYDKERQLIQKMKNWAKKYNEGWKPNWKDMYEGKYIIQYINKSEILEPFYSYYFKEFSKLPTFKSEKIAEQFIEEFGEEIKEVLC